MNESRWFRWATTSARTIVGAAVAVGVTVLVVTTAAAPWPTVTRDAPVALALPEPAEAVVACSGPVLALGRTIEDVARISVASPTRTTAGAPPGEPSPEAVRLASPAVTDSPGAPSFVAAPIGDEPAQVAAASSATLSDEDLTGFAASACRQPLMESWIVGGQTTTGAADILLLSNTGDATATVQLTVFGATGAQVPPGATGFAVAGGTQVVLPLAGVAGGEEGPIIRVSATGAPVTASLQSSLVRTLVPGGLDVQGAIRAAERVQVIAGVTVASTPGEETGMLDTLVRLLAPAADTAATITVTSVGGSAPRMTQTLPLTAGVPAELALSDLPDGEYVVTVEAEEPVVAAAWHTSGFGVGSDFAWYASSPRVPSATVVAVPRGPSPRLVLVNRGSDPVEVTLADDDGAEQTATVPAQGSTSIPVTEDAVWTVDPSGGELYAAVTFAGPGSLAGIPVWPADTGAEPIAVYP